MKFRPCIDIHNGKVKQIVGGSLKDRDDQALENFVSKKDAAYFAGIYRDYHIKGGHIILLNSSSSEFYNASKNQAAEALKVFPGGFQIGGGITIENASEFLKLGASHVIVTSYVFHNGKIDYKNLNDLYRETGKQKLVLDLSCRKMNNAYFIVTDRWQTYTDVQLNKETMQELAEYCDEFLIHAVDVEGKSNGIEEELADLIGRECHIPVTYAGGVHNFKDLDLLKKSGNGKIDVTIGSSLDLFGGSMRLDEVLNYLK